MRRLCMLMAAILTIAMLPVVSEAFASVDLMSCRDVRFESYGVRQAEITPISCGGEFSSAEPFIVLIIDVKNVDRRVDVGTQVLDPNGGSVAGDSFVITPPPAGTWAHYWSWIVMPVAATREELTGKGLSFLLHVKGLGLTPPIRERLGEWTLSVTLVPGSTRTHKFTLKP